MKHVIPKGDCLVNPSPLSIFMIKLQEYMHFDEVTSFMSNSLNP